MFQSFLQSLAGFPCRVREDAILNPIMIQDLSLIVVVSVLASNVPASNWMYWCCTHFATCSDVSVCRAVLGLVSYPLAQIG